MSSYNAARIEKTPYFRLAPVRQGRGGRPVEVVGWDSEAEAGAPFCMQLSATGGPEEAEVIEVPPGRWGALTVLLRYLHDRCRRRGVEHVVFGWHLAYEWTQLFADLPDETVAQGEFLINVALDDETGASLGHYRLEVFADRRYAMRVLHLESKTRVTVLDGMAFFKTSLDNAGRALGLGEKVKLDDDTKREFTRADLTNPVFLEYARHDAWLTRKIGEHIIGMHEEYDVRTCLTAPHFASSVFRRHFLTGEIPLAAPELEQAGLAAYHGGKNGFYLPGPRRIERAYSYDITSAYPEAMRALPDPTLAVWVEAKHYRPGAHALWCVGMDYRGCPYPGLLTHDDHKLTPGRYDGLWVTGYELDAVLERGEASLSSCWGYVMSGEGGGPLVDYVDRFFALKARSEGATREQAKLFLNSLYGKFFQKVALGSVGWLDWATGETRVTDPGQLYDYRAGGLYHPPIAGLITGFVRGKIHRLEHKYGSVMTSTDGFFAEGEPDPADLGARLGGLTVGRGDLSIWRERLYVFDPEGAGGCCLGRPERDKCKGHRAKAALHGFRGHVDDLRLIPLTPGEHKYVAEGVVTLRQSRTMLRTPEGTRVSARAGRFLLRPFTLVVEGAA
jgi:hypothetical protein